MTLRYSKRAEADLLSIGSYTLPQWGPKQASMYLEQIEHCCQLLAANPELGRSCGKIRPGLRRMEEGRHVVFYRKLQDGVLISRILHQRMLPELHEMDDDQTSASGVVNRFYD